MNRQPPDRRSDGKQPGHTIPDQPRDCGPHVDTWPILDAQAGEQEKQRQDEVQRKR
jgi:hypothetical protein